MDDNLRPEYVQFIISHTRNLLRHSVCGLDRKKKKITIHVLFPVSSTFIQGSRSLCLRLTRQTVLKRSSTLMKQIPVAVGG